MGIDLSREESPDATTVLKFRRLLEQHQLTRALFEKVVKLLGEWALMMREGTLADAAIIAAPPSTKNAQGKRDVDMHQTRSATCGTSA